MSGTTEILVGSAAEEFLPHSNLCVKFFVVALRLVEHALPFRGILGEKSIYHPRVRRLAVERFAAASASTGEQLQQQQATLLHQTKLTPTISRFRFRLHQPNTTSTTTTASTYQPGQYITLDFSSHLNIGYSHMRDDDPRSLNDDFVRTFTVSGFYQQHQQQQQQQQKEETLGKCGDEFEITIRKVVGGGVVTGFLFGYGGDDESHQKENQDKREKEGEQENLVIDVKGFGGGGEFTIFQQEQEQEQQEQQKNTPTRIPKKTEKENAKEKRRIFIAAGIGITPIIPFLSTFSSSSFSSSLNLKILWTVKMEDLAFVWDVVEKVAQLEMGQEGLSKKKEKGKGIRFVVFVTGWKNQHTDDDDHDHGKMEKEEKKAKAIINRLRKFPEIVDAVYFRRMGLDDVNYLHLYNDDEKENDEKEEKEKEEKEVSTKYYLCTGEKMKREVMGWLSEEGGGGGGGGGEKEVVVVEDFTF